ncbi:MAG: PepSY domain-containing protein, partial [Proteobacteria bacterium]
DPHSAQVVGIRTRTSSVNGWISWLHFNLFAGEMGELLNGYGAALASILLATGLYLWWPRTLSLLRQAITIKREASTKRRIHDIHNVAGIASLGILLLTCVTGVVFVWKKPVENSVFALTQSKPNPKIKVASGSTKLSFTRLYQIGDAAIDGRWVSSVDLPRKATDPFILRKDLPTSERWRGSVSAFIDPYSGRVLKISDSRDAPSGARIMELNFPLHAGMWGGIATKILYSLCGLMPLILFVTGVWKWNSKRVGRARNRHKRVSEQPKAI